MALPGIAAVIADGRLRISPELSGNKVTILGTSTATGLTLLEPYSVTNGKLAIAALEHVSGDPSELSLAVEECLMSGCQNLEVVQIARTSGELAAFTANSRWDALLGAYSALRAHEVEIVHPAATYIDETGLTGTDADSGTRDNFAKQLRWEMPTHASASSGPSQSTLLLRLNPGQMHIPILAISCLRFQAEHI